MPRREKNTSGPASMTSLDPWLRLDNDVKLPPDGTRKRRRIELSPAEENARSALISPSEPGSNRTTLQGKMQDMTPDRTSSTRNTNIGFATLNVKPWLVSSLSSMAITKPTPIQRECIPPILQGRDCIGGSRTGSGKTVAFAIPIIQKWAEDPRGIFGLVLTPTRYSN